jgi:hypothetical protein
MPHEPKAAKRAYSAPEIAALREELDWINQANVVFWKQGLSPNREARAEHQQRQDRLQKIMKELALVPRGQWTS